MSESACILLMFMRQINRLDRTISPEILQCMVDALDISEDDMKIIRQALKDDTRRILLKNGHGKAKVELLLSEFSS